MVVRVSDRQQVVLRVIGVLRQVTGGVGHASEAIGVVITVRSDVQVLVGDGGAAPTGIVAKAHRALVRISDFG